MVLLPIYPARELPVEGVDAELIGRQLTVPWRVVPREQIAYEVGRMVTDVVVSFGAGNIENCCPAIAEELRRKVK